MCICDPTRDITCFTHSERALAESFYPLRVLSGPPIPDPALRELDADRARTEARTRAAGWVRLDEVLAALRELDPVEAALAGQGAFLMAADLLAEQFGAVTDVSSTDVPMRAHTDQETGDA